MLFAPSCDFHSELLEASAGTTSSIRTSFDVGFSFHVVCPFLEAAAAPNDSISSRLDVGLRFHVSPPPLETARDTASAI